MSSHEITLQPMAHPVTVPWTIRSRDALWSWEVRHTARSHSSGVHDLEHIARDALEGALLARGGQGILQICTLVTDNLPSMLGTTYAYGRVVARAHVAGGRVAWVTPVITTY